ncbi:MAG: phosphoenolpyruvate--protein phosphotransferase [Candidatus Promineifilaceae bacterium]
MVGIVVVSHSEELAKGVVILASQMAMGKVAIAAAGGIDDPEHPIGTDPMRVLSAIETVYSEDGVVVLMDLGSALMSAETAVEFLDPEQQSNVYLCAAPLVEGAVAAVVQAAVGGNVVQVMAEAKGALAAKLSLLGDGDTAEVKQTDNGLPTDPAGARLTFSLTVRNKMGLHARPAAQLVGTANRFSADIQIVKGERGANAKSINQVATLGVRQGDAIQVTAVGEDAQAALDAIKALAADDFGEAEEPEAVTEMPVAAVEGKPENALAGIPASPGIAIGPVFQYRPQRPEIVKRQVADGKGELERLETAVRQAQAELKGVVEQVTKQVGPAEAEIFEAHRLILQDPDLMTAAKEIVLGQGVNAEYAWEQVIKETADRYRALDDAYMQARAGDVMDAGGRVLRQLVAYELPGLDVAEPAILVAADLTPSDTAELDPAHFLGIVTELGGATAHSAILARALGIPAVVGVGKAAEGLAGGQMIGLDGEKGLVYTDLNGSLEAELGARRDEWLAALKQAQGQAQEGAVTLDGHRVEIVANIGGLHDATVALDYGAEGVGLFRTEFLFMAREAAPTEAEQLAVYRQIAETMGKRPLVIRTLDIGGDKPLPYWDSPPEANPFLGLRGIRFCLANPDLFKSQLRAILQASPGHQIKLMFPMIGSLSELRAAKGLLAEVQAELRTAKVPFDEEMEVGMMIEVPSAVAVADQLAKEVDFFSIGTNDLTQYLMAADRGNAKVASLVNALQPAVLRMIRQTVEAGHAAGIWVGVCGELGGNAKASALLVGLGLDELSMNAPAIPAVKAAIRGVNLEQAEKLAGEILEMETVEGVEKALGRKGNN